MKRKINWNDKDKLVEIVESSINVSEALTKLDLKVNSSNNHATFKKYIEIHKIDISHFTGKPNPENKPARVNKSREPLENYLTINSDYGNTSLKRRLLKENYIEYKCAICCIETWLNSAIVLQLDHINGVNTDNRLENLRLLCPNCHSQTDTYCGRNANRSKKELPKCIDCNCDINQNCIRCRTCNDKHFLGKKTKIDWPPLNEIINLVKNIGYTAAGRKLGISDNGIRKHIKKHS